MSSRQANTSVNIQTRLAVYMHAIAVLAIILFLFYDCTIKYGYMDKDEEKHDSVSVRQCWIRSWLVFSH